MSKFTMNLWPLVTMLIFLGNILQGYLGPDVGNRATGVRLEISPIGWTFSIWFASHFLSTL